MKIYAYNLIEVIGRGGFGKVNKKVCQIIILKKKVWKVEIKKTKEIHALKIMSKAKILLKNSVRSVLNERRILSNLKHE